MSVELPLDGELEGVVHVPAALPSLFQYCPLVPALVGGYTVFSVTPVICPCASYVISGIAVVLPFVAAVTELL